MGYLNLSILSVIFLCCGCSVSNNSECPLDLTLDAVQVDKIKSYEGCRAIIVGNVNNVYHSKSAHYMNFGVDYKKSFSVVVFSSDAIRAGIRVKDIDDLEGKDVQVSGVIKTYRPDWSFTSKPQIIMNNLQNVIVGERIEGAILPKGSSGSVEFKSMLLASAKELKANSAGLCEAIKSGNSHDQLNKNNKIQFNKTFNLINNNGGVFFESNYGEDKNMIPIIDGLEMSARSGKLYMAEIPFYGKIRDAEDLLYLSDFYYWYSIPLYNKYLNKNIIDKFHIEKSLEDFYQPCNLYLYKIDKEWDEQWDFSKNKNPTHRRYYKILGRLD